MAIKRGSETPLKNAVDQQGGDEAPQKAHAATPPHAPARASVAAVEPEIAPDATPVELKGPAEPALLRGNYTGPLKVELLQSMGHSKGQRIEASREEPVTIATVKLVGGATLGALEKALARGIGKTVRIVPDDRG